MRVLVCGGRDYQNRDLVFATLDRLVPTGAVIITGGANGADRLVWLWALHTDRAADALIFAPDWKKHGKAAGPIRNQQMIDEGKPDLVIAFPGGRGTSDMVSRARKAGIRVEALARVGGE
jgi:hypothetical protein